MEAEQAVRDVLPGHPLARHIDDFLTDLANANKPRNTIRAYRGRRADHPCRLCQLGEVEYVERDG